MLHLPRALPSETTAAVGPAPLAPAPAGALMPPACARYHQRTPQLHIKCTTCDKIRPHYISYALQPHPKAPIYTFLYLAGSQTL